MIERAKYTPKTNLTLSAVPDLLPADAQAASAIERELAWVDELRRGRFYNAADRALDDLFDDVLGGPPRLTESELRLLDGNR